MGSMKIHMGLWSRRIKRLRCRAPLRTRKEQFAELPFG
jgi:hypothetical protein